MRPASVLLALLLSLSLSAETFQSHDGTVLHYDVIGNGGPVLLLSGGPGFSPDYLIPIARKLEGSYQFIVLHQRGTGRSVVDPATLQMPRLVADIEALRKHLDIPKLVIAGHSFGGIMAMMYAREHPQNVGGLLLIGSGGPTLKSVPKFNANLEARFSEEERAVIKEWSDPQRLKEQRARAVFEIAKAKTPAYFADRSKAHLLTDPMTEDSFRDSVFWALVPQMMALDLRAGLEKVEAPVLVIHGRQDPLESAEEVHETFPGSKLELLDGAGHFPWLEQPEKFYAAVDAFLKTQYAEMCH